MTLWNYLRYMNHKADKFVEIRYSPISGQGLFSKKKIKRGEVVVTNNKPQYVAKINDGDFKFPTFIESADLYTRCKRYSAKRSNLDLWTTYFGGFWIYVANRDISKGEELTHFYGLEKWFGFLAGSIVGNVSRMEIDGLNKMVVVDPQRDLGTIKRVAKKMDYKLDVKPHLLKIAIIGESLIDEQEPEADQEKKLIAENTTIKQEKQKELEDGTDRTTSQCTTSGNTS